MKCEKCKIIRHAILDAIWKGSMALCASRALDTVWICQETGEVKFIVDSKLPVSPVGSQPFQLIIFRSSEFSMSFSHLSAEISLSEN